VQEDIGVDAVKIGMLGTIETVEAVSAALDLLPAGTPIVLDPVMVAESGAELLEPAAKRALIALMLPRATVVTPNVPEARALANAHVPDLGRGPAHVPDQPEDIPALAVAIRTLGPDVVVVTGGHREQAVDVFFDGEEMIELPGERVAGGAAHGSGCTHSSALAAHLALGYEPLEAARRAKRLAAEAIRNGLRGIGAGVGPVDVLGIERATAPAVAASDREAPLT
jgi:hydroxymethylpyrimidine/phosphomethylpyrimidine kinase